MQLVTVVGEPGVGKSRLVGELADALSTPSPELVSWRQGRCLPYGDGVTFWALGEIVKAQAGILESDAPARSRPSSRRRPPWSPTSRSATGSGAAGPPGRMAGPDAGRAERAEAFAAWRRFLEAMAASGPLVLVVEDLHWADEAMLDFVEHLVDGAGGVPLLVLATARPELLRAPARLGRRKRNPPRSRCRR